MMERTRKDKFKHTLRGESIPKDNRCDSDSNCMSPQSNLTTPKIHKVSIKKTHIAVRISTNTKIKPKKFMAQRIKLFFKKRKMAISPKRIEEFRKVVFSPSVRNRNTKFTSPKKTACLPKVNFRQSNKPMWIGWTDDQKYLIERLSNKVLEAKMSRFNGFSSPCALTRTLNKENFSCDRKNFSFDSEIFNSTDEIKQSFLTNMNSINFDENSKLNKDINNLSPKNRDSRNNTSRWFKIQNHNLKAL